MGHRLSRLCRMFLSSDGAKNAKMHPSEGNFCPYCGLIASSLTVLREAVRGFTIYFLQHALGDGGDVFRHRGDSGKSRNGDGD